MAQTPIELGPPVAGDFVQQNAEIVGSVHRNYWLANKAHYNDRDAAVSNHAASASCAHLDIARWARYGSIHMAPI
jgi:hypothetical protein